MTRLQTKVPNRTLIGIGAIAVACLMTSQLKTASAYVQTMTCNPTGQYACAPGEDPIPVQWDTRCIIYHINENGTQDTDLQRTFDAIERSFEAWNEPSCSNMETSFGGFTNENRIGFKNDPNFQNSNLIIFRDDSWPHGSGVLALTSVTFKPSDGIIQDADIELNSAEYRYSTTDTATLVGIDVANTVTHEAGHFLGLDHSNVNEATMYSTAIDGETKKRDLHEDDIEGICAIYPAGFDNANACTGAPVGYFERETAQRSGATTSTCSIMSQRRPGQKTPLFALALLCLFGYLSRRVH